MQGLEVLGALVDESVLAHAREGGELVAVELMTTDREGWPHVAWLGPGEILVVDDATLVWFLWEHSSASRNLQEGGRALLQAVSGQVVAKWRLHAEPLGTAEISGRKLAGFRGRVTQANSDAVPYAAVTSGLRFCLREPTEQVVGRWEVQLARLRALAASA